MSDMHHYKPLYGNPSSLHMNPAEDEGTISISEVVSGGEVPLIFEGDRDVWESLIFTLTEGGLELPPVLDVATFNALDLLSQQEVHSLALSWYESDDQAAALQDLLDVLQNLSNVGGGDVGSREIAGPPADAQDDAVDLAVQALAQVYPMQNLAAHDIFFVLVDAIQQTQDALGLSVDLDAVVSALEAFNSISFPDYQPEELASCVYLMASGASEIIDAEEQSLILDDSRPDALCSDRNKALILAAFGATASDNFMKFCNAAPQSRMVEWEDVAGRNISTLLGVDNATFETFVLDAFDSSTSEELVREGSRIIADLIDSVKESPESAFEPAPAPSTTVSAEGGEVNMYVAGGIVAASAIGLTMLYRKLRNQ